MKNKLKKNTKIKLISFLKCNCTMDVCYGDS